MRKIVVATHNGRWHADEILAIALLTLVFPLDEILIIRTRDAEKYKDADFLIDIGLKHDGQKYFDHHQSTFDERRSNGIEYASFGLVWKKFGPSLCRDNNAVWQMVDERLVQPIDAYDCGMQLNQYRTNGVLLNNYGLQSIFAAMACGFIDKEPYPISGFNKCVNLGKEIIKNEINACEKELIADNILSRYIANLRTKILILDLAIPFKQTMANNNIWAIISPNENDDGSWCVVLKNMDAPGYSFHSDWIANPRSCGIAGVKFIHKGGHFAICETKESAIELTESLFKILQIPLEI